MSILIQKPGLLSTVQDLGRFGYRRFGVNPNGAMDTAAARLANIILGNDDNQSVIEMHFPGAEIRFESNAIFAIGGGDFRATLDEQTLGLWRPYFAQKGAVLKFSHKRSGNRTYLAIRGGLKVAKWLGSVSTNLAAEIGGLDGRKLTADDRLELNRRQKLIKGFEARAAGRSVIPSYRPLPTVRITKGAEFELLDDAGRAAFGSSSYAISIKSNRMGFRLSGDPLTLERPGELLSSAVSFGTIQLLPDGQLIVLMADHQTTGGYPRIAHIVSDDLPLIAQLGPSDTVAFHMIDHDEAERLALDYERQLNLLRVACRLQSNSWA